MCTAAGRVSAGDVSATAQSSTYNIPIVAWMIVHIRCVLKSNPLHATSIGVDDSEARTVLCLRSMIIHDVNNPAKTHAESWQAWRSHQFVMLSKTLRVTTQLSRHARAVTTEAKSRVTAVLGSQWGDEGKGKLADVLAKECVQSQCRACPT